LNTLDDNKFLKIQVKDAMKHNKLLDVALNKTNRQSDSIREFLKRNKLISKRDSVVSIGSNRLLPNNIIKEEHSREINNSTEYNIQNYDEN
jgi:hypothetical protein